jgi:gamma-glutamyl:cysteine ligase YbdK (ATP-grasp superfamily)
VEQNFGKSAPFSLGVEEEFQILNSESHELVSRIDEILPALEGDREEKRIKAELSSPSSRSQPTSRRP